MVYKYSVEFGESRKRFSFENFVGIDQFKHLMLREFEIDADAEDLTVQEWDEDFSNFYDIESLPFQDLTKLRVIVRQMGMHTSRSDESSGQLGDDPGSVSSIPLTTSNEYDSLLVDTSNGTSNPSQVPTVKSSARCVARHTLYIPYFSL